jgi:hypothetical protein
MTQLVRQPITSSTALCLVVALLAVAACGGATVASSGGEGGDASRDAAAGASGEDAEIVPPAMPFDGVCTPGDVRLGYYDPDCVYVLGANLRAPVLTDPAAPSRQGLGLPSFPLSSTIRVTDGRMLFVSAWSWQVAEFRPIPAGEFATDGALKKRHPASPRAADPGLRQRSGDSGVRFSRQRRRPLPVRRSHSDVSRARNVGALRHGGQGGRRDRGDWSRPGPGVGGRTARRPRRPDRARGRAAAGHVRQRSARAARRRLPRAAALRGRFWS